MILVSIWSAEGEGRVSRDQKVGDDGKYMGSTPVHYESAVLAISHTAIQP
jgi:hypothetical protein